MTRIQRLLLIDAGVVLLSALVTVHVSKRAVRKKCRTVVRRECTKVPVFGEEFCADKAEEICDP